jgi:hypothetical protein
MSTPSSQFALWHGIARDSIPWFQDITEFLYEMRFLIRGNQLVPVNESRD